MKQPTALPDPKDWHTLAQLVAARPFLTPRTVTYWCETGQLRYTQRGQGGNAMRLFKLADVDVVLDRHVKNNECGAEAAGLL